MVQKRLSAIVVLAISSIAINFQVVAAPIVPGKVVSTWANIYRPAMLTFDAQGNLYVGNDDNDRAGVRIYRVTPSGVLSSFGDTAIYDPDAVAIDTTGIISGTAGTVLVGAGYPGTIYTIDGNEVTQELMVCGSNPGDMVVDSTGRLLIADPNVAVHVTSGQAATPLFSIGDCYNITVDQNDNIYLGGCTDGRIRVYRPDPDGILLLDDIYDSVGSAALAFGPGGSWGTSLYALAGGDLLRFDTNGNPTVIGTGFSSAVLDIAFGPDDGLYVSSHGTNEVLKIIPEPATLSLDVLPSDDPNYFTVKKKADSKSRLPMEVYGSEELDAADIDLGSIRVAGTVIPVKISNDGDENMDGYADLVIHVNRVDLINALDLSNEPEGAVVDVVVTGAAVGGSPIFEATDSIVIHHPGG